MSGYSFNLVDRPWIPCVENNGEMVRLGLRDLLLRAHEMRGIEHQNPLTEAALFRVLLALVHRIVDGPKDLKEWKGLYGAGRLPKERIDGYLEKWRHRFDLFSEKEPFYQTAGLAVMDNIGKESPLPISCLKLESANGNNKTVFDHTTDEAIIALIPCDAALALVTAQMYSLGGLNKKTTNHFNFQQSFLNGTMVNGIFAALRGSSLFETIVLNLLVYKEKEPIPSTRYDCPVWERDDMGADGKVTPKGYLDFLTPKCRHIRLVHEQLEDEIFVRFVHIAQGEAFMDVDNPAFFRRMTKGGRWIPVQLHPDRLVWRDSSALFAIDQNADRRPKAFRQVGDIALKRLVPLASRYRCMTYGLANDKANPLAWRKEALDIPVSILSEKDLVMVLQKSLEVAERAGNALRDGVKRFLREYLPEKSRDVAEKMGATGVMGHYWDRLERHFHSLLANIEKREEAYEAWNENVKRTAREAFESCLRHRYADSAGTYRAWCISFADLNSRLSDIDGKEEGN